MEDIKPISPAGAKAEKINRIHPNMIKVVNELIVKNFTSYSAVILQDDIVSEFLKITPDYTKEKIFEEKQLDFEPIFRKIGWTVNYDKPGWDENYSSRFKFTTKKNKS